MMLLRQRQSPLPRSALARSALRGSVARGLAWLSLLLAAATAAWAETGMDSPYFQVTGAAVGVEAFPLKSTEVAATLTAFLAEVRVRQTYTNEGQRPLEANYVFPGSTRAAVHGLTMTVGGRRIEAVIREKTDARRTYENARRQGQVASLLEAHRSNLFEMHVANIQPGETVTVELRYTEWLRPESGLYEWIFPTAVGARYLRSGGGPGNDAGGAAGGTTGSVGPANPDPAAQEPPAADAVPAAPLPAIVSTRVVAQEPVFSVQIDLVAGPGWSDLESPSHPVQIAKSTDRVRVGYLSGDTAAMDRDFVLRYRLAAANLAPTLLTETWRGESYFMVSVQPPARIASADVPPRDYVFVVDISGSMHGFPLDTAKKLLRELLLSLRAQDTFNVVLFAGSTRALSEAPLPASPETLAAAVQLLDTQAGGGGTELLRALQRALALPRRPGLSRSVVVVTDGYVDVEAEAYALVKQRLGEANLFAFGIGSAVNRELIERLARAGRAEATVISSQSDAVSAARRFREQIETPVLSQVRVDLASGSVHDVLPAALPDVLAERPIFLVGKGRPGESGPIRVRGFRADGPWEMLLDPATALSLDGSGLLAQLWARERLDQLRDLHAIERDEQKIQRKAAIVELGLQYNLLTPFTSFVAVDTTPRPIPFAPDAAGRTTDFARHPTSQPAGVESEESVPTTPEPATWALIAVAAAIAGWRFWCARQHALRTA